MVNKTVIKIVGLDSAVLLGELCSEYNSYLKSDRLTDGMFFASIEDIKEKTGLSDDRQRSAIKALSQLGIIEQVNRGIPCTRWFKLNEDNLESLFQDTPKTDNQFQENDTTSFGNLTQLDLGKCHCNNIINKNIKNNNNRSSTKVEDKEKLKDKKEDNKLDINMTSKSFKEVWKYINSLPHSISFKETVKQWYDNIGRGRVSPDMLKEKLSALYLECNKDITLTEESIKNCTINSYFKWFNKNNNFNDSKKKTKSYNIPKQSTYSESKEPDPSQVISLKDLDLSQFDD